MNLTIAAIRSGTDPVGALPPGAFHRWLDDPIVCPKCDATYNLVADYTQSTNKFFEDEARPLITLLAKTVFRGHAFGHKVSHFETSGVVVQAVTKAGVEAISQKR